MHRMMFYAFSFILPLASSAPATPPTPQPPLEEQLAKMQVIVAGELRVEGEGPARLVSLEISHVLKQPDDLKQFKPEIVLPVTPRGPDFSDQAGKGVWSLKIDQRDMKPIVAKYEFITYHRNLEEIKKSLEAIATKP